MALLPIVKSIGTLTMNVSKKLVKDTDGHGDVNYSDKSGMFTATEEEFQGHISDMVETLKDSRAVGLASIQVGVPLAIMVVKTKTGTMILINPEIQDESETLIEGPEGCLSFEGKTLINQRPKWTKVIYRDRHWETHVKIFRDFESVIFQHEFEHLLGLTMMAQHSFTSYDSYKEFRRVILSGYTGAIDYQLVSDESFKADMDQYLSKQVSKPTSLNPCVATNISLLKVDMASYPWLKFKEWKPSRPLS